MKIKRLLARALIVVMILSQCMTSFAGAWANPSPNVWMYEQDDGTYLKNSWYQDPADGNRYYLNGDGVMLFGWHLIDQIWYFFNTSHDGTYGAAYKDGWHWVDGYCYYFDSAGKMAADCVTPDGYTVNASGQWMENGSAVYIEGKGVSSASPSSATVTFGWNLVNGIWYFVPSVHDGTLDSALKNGWYWVDGYCYYFDDEGKMAAGCVTPDGYTVNASGQWMENGSAVYQAGRGISTKTVTATTTTKKSSGGGGGGGGGSSSGGSSGGGSGSGNTGGSTVVTRFTYSIQCVDETGAVLKSDSYQADADTFVTITAPEITGYVFKSGDTGSKKIASEGQIFTLTYEAEEVVPETYAYTVYYVDVDTDDVIDTKTGTGVKDSQITITDTTIAGYVPVAGNSYTFLLSSDGMEHTLYYEEEAQEFRYSIIYCVENGVSLATLSGSDLESAMIEIPEKSFDGYKFSGTTFPTSFILNEDGKTVYIYYVLVETTASPSEPVETLLSYTIEYIDRDTGDVLFMETGSAAEGTTLVPTFIKEDYEYASSYSFELTEDGETFTVYMVNINDTPETETITYQIQCVDENGDAIYLYTGSVEVGDDPVTVTPEIEIDGYVMTGTCEFEVTRDGDNLFTLTFESEQGDYAYTIVCVDIDTSETIETQTLYGDAGDILDISGICPEGYEITGNAPVSVTVSSVAANNTTKIFFKKISEPDEPVKEARFTIQFRSKADHSLQVLSDVIGTYEVGKPMAYYFTETISDSEGNIWKSVDKSPRTFTLEDQEMNTFLIEYLMVQEAEEEDLQRTYTIKYVAEDTGSILGVTTGLAEVGDSIPFRNTFTDYGFKDSVRSHKITEDEHNLVEVVLKRTAFPGHEVNGTTGAYDGCNWLAIFVDSNGNQLLPNVTGFTVKGDTFYIDYPDVIEDETYTYRAVTSSPYQEIINGTVYRQYVIQYVTGSSSEDKLADWQQKAQEKKDAFYGTTPYSYYVAYRERNSWNDFGLLVGVAPENTEIILEAKEFDGWNAPMTSLGSFMLDADGKYAFASYEKADGTISVDDIERTYTFSFEDAEGNQVFEDYSGKLAFKKSNEEYDFTVYYPDFFYDREGNRWAADEKSPSTVKMSALSENEHTITYSCVYENEKEQFIVTNNAEFNQVLRDFASHTADAAVHSFYLIGRDYDTLKAEVSSTVYQYDISGYGNEQVDVFNLNGTTYYVSLVQYKRNWPEEICTHSWTYEDYQRGSCYTAAEQLAVCEKCGAEETVIEPAVGHVDENRDSVCDVCKTGLKVFLGDEISVDWDSEALGFGVKTYYFVCIDDNYKGTGDLLFVSQDGIGSDIWSTYTEADTMGYSASHVREFLNGSFAGGLSVANAMSSFANTDAVTMLTKDEYDSYKNSALNNFMFPTGTYLTRSDFTDKVVLTSGAEITKESVDSYEVHPAFLLKPSEAVEGIRSGIWKEGDLHLRAIGEKNYIFRCVDASYTDSSNSGKTLAVFLCDSVIPANEALGFDEPDGTQSTRFFGADNNYKNSTVNSWLQANVSKTGNLTESNIGILTEYTGSTAEGTYSSFDVRDFTSYDRSTPQVFYSNFFIPSLEEAIAMKSYLWKFNNSDSDNAEEVTGTYCNSYWLRTPVYGTSDMVYTVNLKTGAIEPKKVSATAENMKSDTGIRPVYFVEQAD